MSAFGKKILSAFVEIKSPDPAPADQTGKKGKKGDQPESSGGGPGKGGAPGTSGSAGASGSSGISGSAIREGDSGTGSGRKAQEKRSAGTDGRFAEYFDKLFREANIPGPDYYEFARMVEAMQVVPDEASRFAAAFAGLQVQGLTRDKLLSTAGEYVRVLDADAAQFHAAVDAALQEKVHSRRSEAEEKRARIEILTKEIDDLKNRIRELESGIREEEEKLGDRSAAYSAGSEQWRAQIGSDMEKIKHYLR